jgi:hypothetical protein
MGKNKKLLRKKSKLNKKDYFGALKGIGHFTKRDRMKGQLE